MRALLLDAELRHAIDVVRSLGRRGLVVDLVSATREPAASASRYAGDAFLCPKQLAPDDRSLLTLVTALLESRRHNLIIAAGLSGTGLLARHTERLRQMTCCVAPDADAFEVAEDKYETATMARRAGIEVPMTVAPRNLGDLDECADWGFPIVVKARGGQGRFGYASSPEELIAACVRIAGSDDFSAVPKDSQPLVQEYIEGSAHGYFALCSDGDVLASFMHRRIREVPPSGGPSAVAATYDDPLLEEAGRRALSALRWSGVAMVEFKREKSTGRYVLIEINPKFWGSLGLAVAAGVDFPWLLARLALGLPIEPPTGVRQIEYQWLSMNIAHSVVVRRPWLWIADLAHGVSSDFSLRDPLPLVSLFRTRAIDVASGRRQIASKYQGIPGAHKSAGRNRR